MALISPAHMATATSVLPGTMWRRPFEDAWEVRMRSQTLSLCMIHPALHTHSLHLCSFRRDPQTYGKRRKPLLRYPAHNPPGLMPYTYDYVSLFFPAARSPLDTTPSVARSEDKFWP
ncbi:hypothetical protein MIND_00905000 [Mycena indigotica]|uniref:Uncharacterized protein n=1 Tax=Mycena indigotica TaxID=2126181 RepID=A0A8H6VWM3_9AGAR|nr:uncharacterized protein MIND_00905000 [Mycena indigotica]KAF7296744.1 hypothetical protein MIND_00905000 [Mycena indigotica]